MRHVPSLALLAALLLAGCHRSPTAEAIEQNYDNCADALDRSAENQSTGTARAIYHDQADAIRQEGQERAEGLAKAEPDRPPANGQ